MITAAKKLKLQAAIKLYYKNYLSGKITDLDESGTRILINSFLTEVLGYHPLEEVKTEYMIRGTYADYMVQKDGNRFFLVEVKAFSLNLSEKHLRQAINYGANEGIEWALLTNGKVFSLYKILFNKPIESRKVISIDLTDEHQLKTAVELLQYMHRDYVFGGGLAQLWNKHSALVTSNIAAYILSDHTISYIRKNLNGKFKCKFSEAEIKEALTRVVTQPLKIDDIKPIKGKPVKAKKAVPKQPAANLPETPMAQNVSEIN